MLVLQVDKNWEDKMNWKNFLMALSVGLVFSAFFAAGVVDHNFWSRMETKSEEIKISTISWYYGYGPNGPVKK